jgi:hypothetical protein
MKKTTTVDMRVSDYDIRIDRASKWGNPFHISDAGTREEVIQQYREWIMEQPQLLKELHHLKGKRLGCWCSPNSCHGDVLVELADGVVEPEAFDFFSEFEDAVD